MAPAAVPPTLSLPETEDAVKYAKLASLAYENDKAKVGEAQAAAYLTSHKQCCRTCVYPCVHVHVWTCECCMHVLLPHSGKGV